MQTRLDIILETVQRILEKNSEQSRSSPLDDLKPLEGDLGTEWMERTPDISHPNYEKQDYDMNFAILKIGRSLNPVGMVKNQINRIASDKFNQTMRGERIKSDVGIPSSKSPVSPVPFPERAHDRKYSEQNPNFFNPKDDPYYEPWTPEKSAAMQKVLKGNPKIIPRKVNPDSGSKFVNF